MDLSKPDLVFHPRFEENLRISDYYQLKNHFNVLTLKDLTIYHSTSVYIVEDDGVNLLRDVVLQPKKGRECDAGESMFTKDTTYTFSGKQSMYRIKQKNPRYVIWTDDDPLVICATIVNRIKECDLFLACKAAIDWNCRITRELSVVVFDLDDTLIDAKGNKFAHVDGLLSTARSNYDLLILYSHGNGLWVDEQREKHFAGIFDYVVCKGDTDFDSSKNLLHLYMYYPDTRFTKAILIDDTVNNWTPEYDEMIIPHNIKHTIKYADIALNNIRL